MVAPHLARVSAALDPSQIPQFKPPDCTIYFAQIKWGLIKLLCSYIVSAQLGKELGVANFKV